METAVKAPPITVEQFLGFTPPLGYRAELIDGEIIVSPDPKPIHQEVALNICFALRQILNPIEYVVQMRTNFQVENNYYMPSPDVFVVETTRWREARIHNQYLSGAPLVAVEVISPSSDEKNVLKKCHWYLQHGSKPVWMAFPEQRTVKVREAKRKWEIGPDQVEESKRLYLPEPLHLLSVNTDDFFQLL